MKKNWLIILIVSFLGCKSHDYLLTDKKQYENYIDSNETINIVEIHQEVLSGKFDPESSAKILYLISFDRPQNNFYGIDPPPCVPEPPEFLSIQEVREGDAPWPFSPCPLPTLCNDHKNSLSKYRFYFLPTVEIEKVNIYNKELDLVANPEFLFELNENFKILTFYEEIDNIINEVDESILEFQLGSNKNYHIEISSCKNR
ncbi:MAG: hypothetical protein ACOCWM_01460 [Cyclobacteriaceae bacterium]